MSFSYSIHGSRSPSTPLSNSEDANITSEHSQNLTPLAEESTQSRSEYSPNFATVLNHPHYQAQSTSDLLLYGPDITSTNQPSIGQEMVSTDLPVPPEYWNYSEYDESSTMEETGDQDHELLHYEGPPEEYYRRPQSPVPTPPEHLDMDFGRTPTQAAPQPAVQSEQLDETSGGTGIQVLSIQESDKESESRLEKTSRRGRRSSSRRSRGGRGKSYRFVSVSTGRIFEDTVPSVEVNVETPKAKSKSKGKGKEKIVDDEKEAEINQYIENATRLENEILQNLSIFSTTDDNHGEGGSSGVGTSKMVEATPSNTNKDTKQKPFTCPEPTCHVRFKHNADMRRHWLSHIKETVLLLPEDERILKLIGSHACPKCGKPMSRKDSVKRHLMADACGKKEPPVKRKRERESEEGENSGDDGPKKSKKDKEDDNDD